DCPTGLAKVNERTRLFASAIASLLVALFTGVLFTSLMSSKRVDIGGINIPLIRHEPEPLMGAIAIDPKNERKRMVELTGEVDAPGVERRF
ncbi:MAG: hypothetical protein AB7J13_02410, partial [Pyrinomonadaceae bacterium]